MGDLFGRLTQQDGRMIHDIVPIKKHETEQLGNGSKEELTWHTEDAFHELRSDYLMMMMCLRNNDSIPTTLSKPHYSKLTEKQIDILFKKQFTIRPDNSHKAVFGSKERKKISVDDEGLNHAYETISNRDAAPEKIAVLFGNKKDPCLRLYPYFMGNPEDLEIKQALNILIELVSESLIEASLNPGEVMIIDNF